MILKIFRQRRFVDKDNVIIYQAQENPTESDQLHMSFRLLHREPFTKSRILNDVINIFDRIVSNTTTCKYLFDFSNYISFISSCIVW